MDPDENIDPPAVPSSFFRGLLYTTRLAAILWSCLAIVGFAVCQAI